MTRVLGVIPARYGSTRFPGKPLVKIGGVSMIERVYRQAEQSACLLHVVVATDDARIANHVTKFGGNCIITSPHHKNGTSRCAEVVEKLEGEFDGVVNIQGDEPFINPKTIDQVVTLVEQPHAQIATLATQGATPSEFASAHVVKVVTDSVGKALYFSRSAIPFNRDQNHDQLAEALLHVGIYGFKTSVLRQLVTLPTAPPELSEQLEQLRWLWHGFNIHVGITPYKSRGIDTPEDLKWAEENLQP